VSLLGGARGQGAQALRLRRIHVQPLLVVGPGARHQDGRKLAVFRGRGEQGGKPLGHSLPKGKVRVYKADASGQLQFVGEDRIDHTPPRRDLHLAWPGLRPARQARGGVVHPNKDERTETVAITLPTPRTSGLEVEVWSTWHPRTGRSKADIALREEGCIHDRVSGGGACPRECHRALTPSRTGPQTQGVHTDF